MRRYQEPVAVRTVPQSATVPGLAQAPGQFIWNKRLWRVLDIQRHWVEAGAWWRSARAVVRNGDNTGPGAVPGDPRQPQTRWVRVRWLVEAANSAGSHSGVFALCCTGSDCAAGGVRLMSGTILVDLQRVDALLVRRADTGAVQRHRCPACNPRDGVGGAAGPRGPAAAGSVPTTDEPEPAVVAVGRPGRAVVPSGRPVPAVRGQSSRQRPASR